MENSTKAKFQTYYEQHCKHLKLKGLQPKTIEAYHGQFAASATISIIT